MFIVVIGTCPKMPKARYGLHEPLGVNVKARDKATFDFDKN